MKVIEVIEEIKFYFERFGEYDERRGLRYLTSTNFCKIVFATVVIVLNGGILSIDQDALFAISGGLFPIV